MSKYQMLHDRGVVLPDQEIDLVVSAVEQGCVDALQWLEVQDTTWPLFISSDDLHCRVGYAIQQKAINLTVMFLNKLVERLPLDVNHEIIMVESV